MAIKTLRKLQYSEDKEGPWQLYIYTEEGRNYSVKKWFVRGELKYPDEEITLENAKELVKDAMVEGREVRICDVGDMLVFHAERGIVLYGNEFWREVLGEESVDDFQV